MLIDNARFDANCLLGKVVLITGGGGGIGYEASRALAKYGASVIIAEIDESSGRAAEKAVNEELSCNRTEFYKIDIADEQQIEGLYEYVCKKYGCLDVLFNNATIAPVGAVDDVGIGDWDHSYAVNLRAPVLLVQKFLPDMKKRGEGVIVFVSSSGAAPYLGAYEVFKTSQVELSGTLSAELEDTGISVYTIGPGLVKTGTAERCIEKVASMMGMSVEEFYEMNGKHILSVQEAGAGFAASVVLAKKYNGQEISSIQALLDAGIFGTSEDHKNVLELCSEDIERLDIHISGAVNTFIEQSDSWMKRNVFERQWVLRDFKKTTGHSIDQFRDEILNINSLHQQKEFHQIAERISIFEALAKYYRHQYDLLQGFEKNPDKLRENSNIIMNWINELRSIVDLYASKTEQ